MRKLTIFVWSALLAGLPGLSQAVGWGTQTTIGDYYSDPGTNNAVLTTF
jgi:hypothetical protein